MASRGFHGESPVLAVTVDLSQPLSTVLWATPKARSLITSKSVCPKPIQVNQIETKRTHRKWQGCPGTALLLGAWNGAPGGEGLEVLHCAKCDAWGCPQEWHTVLKHTPTHSTATVVEGWTQPVSTSHERAVEM